MPEEGTIVDSARQRAFRVPLDHFRHPDLLVRVKLWLSLAAAAIAAAYVAWLLLDSRAGGRHASPGALTAAHASWNDECRSCHVDFRPLAGGAADLFAPAAERSPAAHRQFLDRACIECHPRQAAPHHANQPEAEVPSCAACHSEHRGATADIRRPTNEQCTSCHANIGDHRAESEYSAEPIKNAARFDAAAHPAFRSLRSDPGNIKFNHWLHLQRGLAATDARQQMKLTDLDPAEQPRYRRFAADGTVQLDCTACHEPQADGGLWQPIAFEQHCRACHRLEIKLADAAARLPHGLSSEQTTQALDGMLLAKSWPAAADLASAANSGAETLVPGKTLGRNLAQKLGEDVSRRRMLAATQVNMLCLQCHFQAGENPSPMLLAEVAPTNIPAMWLKHARFDHGAHSQVECRLCHEAAYEFERPERPSVGDDQSVMIAGLSVCLQCHAQPAKGGGGARHDCAECHRYHHGEQAARADVWSAAKIRPVEFQAVGGFADHSHSKLPLVASCSASGCHGDARAGAPPWRSAQAVWLAADPHASAYDVLWTFRGREITRRLAQQPPGMTEGEQHRQAIEQRCIGCHATEQDEAGLALGVHCESCHGQADEWLKSHQLTSFSRGTPGFIDTKSLPARADVCMPCHVGPQVSGQITQAVDHDLIAAGHPRPNFEFRTYFESLPEHWDRQSDQRRLGPDFHFRSWLAGQQQQAAQFARLRTHFGQTSPDDVREFALFDCASCHHALATGEATAGRPRPPHWPRGDLREAQPLAVAGSLLAEAAIVNRNTFDDNVQTYLALQAVAADLPARPALHSTIDRLGQFLAQDCFFAAGDSRPPTQYDWPRRLDRSQLDLRIQAIRAVLPSLQNPPAGGLAPP